MFDLSKPKGSKEDKFRTSFAPPPILSQGPRIDLLESLKKPKQIDSSLFTMRSSHDIPSRPIQSPGILKSLNAGTSDSVIGSQALKAIVGDSYEPSKLAVEPKTIPEKIAYGIGNLGADLPLWMLGDAVLAKPLSALAKTAPIAKVASSIPKIAPAIGTGVRAGATYGGVIAPVETLAKGDGLQGLIDREKQVPLMALGGTALHGGAQLLGKGIKSGISGTKGLLKPLGVPPELVGPPRPKYSTPRRTYLGPLKLSDTLTPEYKARQAELANTFDGYQLPSDSLIVTKPTQQIIDESLGIGRSSGITQKDVESKFGEPRKLNKYDFQTGYQKASEELNSGMEIAKNYMKELYPGVEGKFPISDITLNRIKEGTGVDIPALIENLNNAESKLNKLTPEQLRMGRASGVIPPLKPRELTPKPEPLPIQPQRMSISGNLPSVDTQFSPVKQLRQQVPLRTPTGSVPNFGEVGPIRSMNASIERPSPASLTIEPVRGRVGQQPNQLATQVTPTKIVGAEPDIPAGLKERGVSENIRTDTNRPDELRDSFSVNPDAYKQLGNQETLDKAIAIFNEGLEPAITKLNVLIQDIKPEAAPLVKMIADKLTLEGNVVRARELMSNAALRATESGQFGQAFRILRDADPETFLMTFDKQLKKLNKEGLEQYGKKWKDFDLTPEELTMVNGIERGNQASYDSVFEQIQSRMANEMPASAFEKVNAWRHISMLMNPKTQIRNVVGNGIMMAMRKSAQRVSGVLQKVLLPESERTQAVFVNKEYKDLASEYFKANEKDLLNGPNKYQEGIISPTMRDKRVFRKSRIGEKLGMDIDILEKTRKFNYELLQKGDNPFFKNAYTDRLASYAQSRGIKDFSKLPQEAFDIANLEAQQATYKDASKLASYLNEVKNPPKSAGIGTKGVAIITEAALPFTKTPINIIKRGIQYSPISIATNISKWRSAAGVDELAKGLTGTGILGLGYLLASQGILTGKVAKDVDLKTYDANTGNFPFSVLGKYSYDWMQPFSVPLSVGVEIYNAVKDNPKDKEKMDNIVSSNNVGKLQQMAVNSANAIVEGLTASGDTVFNMSIMKGVKQLVGGQMGFVEGLAQLPQGYATQFIPTLSNQLAGSIDPLVRQTYVKGDMPQSLKNSIVSRIPFASKTLEPKQTPFGEDMKKIENPIGRTLGQFLSPGIITKEQNIPPKIDSELRRLNEFGLTNQFPTIVPNYIEKTQTHPRITLNPEETTQFQKRVGELTLSSFQKVINSGSYSNAKPIKSKNKTADEVRADLLANAIADSKATAKKEILKSRGLK